MCLLCALIYFRYFCIYYLIYVSSNPERQVLLFLFFTVEEAKTQRCQTDLFKVTWPMGGDAKVCTNKPAHQALWLIFSLGHAVLSGENLTG